VHQLVNKDFDSIKMHGTAVEMKKITRKDYRHRFRRFGITNTSILDLLTCDDGTDGLSRNVGTQEERLLLYLAVED
jgi:hypothetical protein